MIGPSDEDNEFGGSGTGTTTIRLGNANTTSAASNPTRIIYNIDVSGNLTINNTTTRIGVIG